MKHYTTYRIAVDWLRLDLVLCNNIGEVDESIYDNMRFDYEDEDGNARDIFQYFITSASESDVEWLEENFNLLFTYSDKLDCFVLCVDHCGTSWDYVACPISDDLLKTWPELEYTDSCYPPKFEENRKVIKGGSK